MDFVELWTICSSNGIVLDSQQIQALERYSGELVYWNQRINLISRKDIDHLLERHILHSLALLTVITIPPKACCIDVGTGGGLPGIPLVIARPDLRMLLVDSVRKKLNVAKMLAAHTGHHFTKAICTRVENLAQLYPDYRRNFDVIIARAVADTATVLRWTHELVKPTGMHVMFKGGNLDKEIYEAHQAFPAASFYVKPLRLIGAPWFDEQQKQVLIVTWHDRQEASSPPSIMQCLSTQ